MKRTKTISRFFNDIYEMVGEISEGGFTKLAPLAMPAAPAFFFGWAIGTAVHELTNSLWAAICVGAAAAIGDKRPFIHPFMLPWELARCGLWRAA